jgi:cytochrome c-type biogenesis protein CcmH/NrfF
MLGVVSRTLGKVAAASGVLVAASIEAVLIWIVDQLPTWAQLLVYGPPILLAVVGFVALWHQARQRRRQRERAARSGP